MKRRRVLVILTFALLVGCVRMVTLPAPVPDTAGVSWYGYCHAVRPADPRCAWHT